MILCHRSKCLAHLIERSNINRVRIIKARLKSTDLILFFEISKYRALPRQCLCDNAIFK